MMEGFLVVWGRTSDSNFRHIEAGVAGGSALHDIHAAVDGDVPHRVGGAGALAAIPLPLDEDEHAAMCRSAEILQEAIDSLGLS